MINVFEIIQILKEYNFSIRGKYVVISLIHCEVILISNLFFPETIVYVYDVYTIYITDVILTSILEPLHTNKQTSFYVM